MPESQEDDRQTESYRSRIRSARLDRGWSQADLAKAAGLTGSQVGSWERGGSNPSIPELVRLGRALGLSLHWLLTGRGPRDATLLESMPGDGEAQEGGVAAVLGQNYSSGVLVQAAEAAQAREHMIYQAFASFVSLVQDPKVGPKQREQIKQVMGSMARKLGVDPPQIDETVEHYIDRIVDPRIYSGGEKEKKRERRRKASGQ